jgi:hypothetical protein
MAFPGNTLIDVLRDVWTGGSGTGKLRVDATVTPSGTTDANIIQIGGASVTLGQKTMANSFPVVFASDQSSLNINNISGTISLPTGAATEASLAKLTLSQGSTTSGQAGPLILGAVTTAAPSYTTGQSSPISLTTSGALRVFASNTSLSDLNATVAQTGTWNIATITGSITPGVSAGNLGKAEDAAHTTGDVGVMALAVRNDAGTALAGTTGDYIPITTDANGAVHISDVIAKKVGTPTLSSVAASATSVTLLSANTSRRQVVLVNDSSAICYVKFGTTASSTSYTVQMPAIANNIASHLFIDEDPVYTGRIDAIWASATGNMRITEITT